MKILPFCAVSIVMATSAGVSAEPKELDGYGLDVVTAGSASESGANHVTGGLVVANGSMASMINDGTLELSSNAQEGAQALNLVNATQSRIANALNVWDGVLTNAQIGSELNVDQVNTIDQIEATRSASLGGYSRDASVIDSEMLTADSTSNSRSFSDTNAMVDTTQQVGGKIIDGGGNSSSNGGEGGNGGGGGDGFSLGMPEVDVQVGKGIAGSGTIDIHVDAGQIAYGFDIDTELNFALKNDTSLNTKNALGATRGASNEFETTTDIKNNTNVDFSIDLPEVTFNIAGSACFVIAGKCAANGVQDSTLDTTESSTTTRVREERGAFILDEANAEYVVIDDSSLEVKSNYKVSLADGAQKNARALNVVNSAGSSVANGVNVARTNVDQGITSPLNLIQSNTVTQRY